MRTQPRFFPVVTRVTLGVAALVAVLFAAGCASKGSGSSGPTAPSLSVTVSGLGAVNPGQAGKYTILVSNASNALATSGTVTVTDPPTNFTITGASGTDWTCTVSGTPPGLTCTNSDVIAPGSSYPLITVTGTVTGGAGSTISIPITIMGGGLATAGSSQGSVSIVSPPTISKAFGSASIGVNATTTLTFTITNPSANTVAQTGLAFADTLPANLVVAPTPGVNNACGGTPTATAGAGVVSLTGGTVGVNTTCTLAVNVTSATVGSYQTNAATLSSTNGGTGSDANATQPTLGVVAFPTVSKVFGAASVPAGGSTSLSFTVANPATNSVSLAGIAFTDSLPAGLVVSTPSSLTGTCGGGTIAGAAGSSSVGLAGATLAQNTSCNFSVNVTGTTAGAKNNAITAISSTQSGTGTINSAATLTVLAPPTISDAFGATSVPLNATSTPLTFTLSNPNASTGLSGVAFADTLPAGLLIATPSGLGSTCNGTATATQGTTAISLTGGTLAAGGSCTIVLNVNGTVAGAQSNTSGLVSSTNGGTGLASNAATLAVLAPPTFSKAFNPGGIAVNGTSALTFTITDPAANTLALTGVGFTDALPANTTVATPNGLVNNCGGTATAVAGTGTVSLSGVTVAASSSCTLAVNVTAAQAGSFTNTTAAVTSTNGGTGLTASAILTAAASPTITKSFLPTSIPLSGTSVLSFTVTSPVANPAPLSNIAFTDTLPTGILVATPNGLTGTCGGGTISGTQGTNSVGLIGATLAPGASCTFSLNVAASSGGAKSNTTGAISSTQSGAGATSNTAILTVVLPPMISDAFGAASVPLSGTPTSLTFTLTNPNASTALSGLSFADTLPAGLLIATPNGLSSTCNGTPTATAATNAISLAGGTLPAGGACTVALSVTGTAVGAQSNTSSVVSSTEGGTGATSNAASLVVLGPPMISKVFGASGVPVNGTTTLTFTLTNPAANTLGLTGVAFGDTLPNGMVVAATPGIANTCGGTPTATAGAGTVSLSGVTLATSSSCALAVNVTATQAGTFNNTTAAVASTNGGTGLTASASLNAAATPTILESFGLSSIPLNNSTSLSFTIANPPSNTVSLTNIAFADTLPSGLVVSTPNGLTDTCGGTPTATAGTNAIGLSGVTLTANTSCTFSLNVTGTSAGAQSNTTGAISSTQSGAGGTGSASLTVVAPPTFSKAFGVSGIGVNATTTLTFALANPAANTVALTGVGFTDTFPAGIQLTATTPVASNTCGVAPTATAGTATVSLSGVTLAASGSCALVVNVTATAPGTFNNTTSAIASTNGGNGLTASASLSAAAAPTISKAFGASSVALNTSMSLSFTVTNPAANTLSLSNITFTDGLPAGLVVSTPNALTGSCGGGAIGATAGSGTVSLGGATLVPSGSCTFSINVTGTTAGPKNNTTSQISSTQSGAGLTANASVTVVVPPQFTSGVFVPTNVPVGSSSTFTLTINNPNAASSLSGVGFTDTLPAGLMVAAVPGLATTCAGGTTASGGNTFSLSGATLTANTSCTFSVNVTGTAAGAPSVITSAVTSNEGGNGNTGTASLPVLGPPAISKAFGASGVPVGGATTLTFTLTNPAANTLALTGVSFTDAFPTGLQLTGTNPSSNTCGVAPTLTSGSPGGVSLSGVTLATGSSCTLVVNVTAITAGTFPNVTGAVSSSNGGTGTTSNTATLNAAISPTFSKAFGAPSIALNTSASLSFTVGNPSSNAVSLSSVAFSDTLPSGLVVSTPNGLTGSCGGGAIGATAGSSTVSLGSATLAPNNSCTFSVNVTGKTAGVQNNITGQISSTQSGLGGTANASVTVVGPPQISKAFGGASVVLGSSTSLTFTITNPNASSTLSGVGFTDTMPSGLVVSTPNDLSGTCGSGTITAVAGSSSVSLSGGTLATSGSCIFSVNVTGNAVGSQNNVTSTVTSTEGGAGNTASASINVTSPCTTNCTISGNVSGPWLADFIITLTPSGGGTPINSSPTGAGGAYNISGLTFGTTYNVSASLLGYTYGPASITVNGNLTGETITATPKVSSDTVTGTVSWAGTQSSTLTTYLNVYDANCTNCGPIGGTTLHGTPAAGGTSYTIPGLSNNTGNSSEPYFVRAQIDTQGTGVPNASDPASNSSPFTLSSSTSAPSVTVAPQTPPAPQTPSLQGVSPSSGTVLISYNAPTDSNGDEIATQYKIYYTTDSNFVSNIASVTLPAGNHNGIYVLSGLTNATNYYFEMSALNVNGTLESARTSVAGPILVGNTTGGAGTFSIAGTVTFSTTPNVNAPLYVGVFSQTLGVYFQRIAPAPGASLTSPAAYSFSGIPSGDYQIFAVLDQNANGFVDAGDVTNFVDKNGPPPISVTANIPSEPAIVLTEANAITFVTTNHTLSGTTNTYDINVGVNPGTKLPVSMTLFSGPNVAVPFSVSFANDNNQYSTLFDNADSAIPAVNDTYQFLVTFADGSTQILSSQVNNVLTSLPTPESMITSGSGITSTNPELNWLAPAAQSPVIATPYTYSVDLNGPNGDGTNENWNYPQNGNGIPSTQTSIVFNSDSKASPDSSLVPGQTYNWDVQVQDANGNTGQSDSTYTVPGGVGPAAKLVFTQQPGNATAGGTIPTVKVTIEDASGNVVTSATNSVAVHIQNNAGGGTLTGGSGVSPVNGVATFSGLSINDAGTGYTLSAASNPALTAAISNPFNVAGAATQLVFTVEPASVGANAPITPAVQVSIEDASNRVVTTATTTVTVAIGTNAGSGTLGGTLSVNAVAGVATFSNLSINNTGNGYTLTASAPGFTTIASTTFNVTTPPTTQIVPLAAPPLQVGGGTRSFTVNVANDASGDLPTVTSFTLNGVACTAATCGSFSAPTGTPGSGTYTMQYTPPATLSAAIVPMVTVSPSVAGPWFAGTLALSVNPVGIVVTQTAGFNIVAPGSGQKQAIFTTYNDVGNAGVTITLTGNGYSCASLPTNSCGSLGTPTVTTNGTTTTTTVLYTPPAAVPAAPYNRVAIQGTSVADPTKLFHQNFLLSSTAQASPLSIPYGQKFDSAVTGGPTATVAANFADATATKSATWKILANGVACPTPTCGTLGTPVVTSNGNNVTSTVTYTPPASVPAGVGQSTPTITATMNANSAATDVFAINIVDGTCSIGKESLLNGSYAFLLKGSGATGGYQVAIGSFTADGNGNITGGGQDINRSIGGQSVASLTGSYSVGSDNRGCLTLTNPNGGTSTYRIALGAVSNGLANQGTITLFTDTTGQGPRLTGTLKQQNLTNVTSSSFSGTYAIGLDGMDSSGHRIAIAGLITSNGAGTITSITEDVNDNGSVTNIPLGTISGTYGLATNATNGRGTFAATQSSVTANSVLYVISPSDAFAMTTDATDPNHPIVSGEARLQTGSFSTSELTTGSGYVFNAAGIDAANGGSTTTLGQAQFTANNGTAATTTVTIDENDNGVSSAEAQGTATFAVSSSGRMTGSGAVLGSGFIIYQVDATQGFLVGLDPFASSGYVQKQTPSSFSTSTITGPFFFGGVVPTNGGSLDTGTVTFTPANPAGVVDGADDSSSPNFGDGGGGLEPNNSISGTYDFTTAPTAPGQGTVGDQSLGYIISPSKFIFMNTGTSQSPNTPELFTAQQSSFTLPSGPAVSSVLLSPNAVTGGTSTVGTVVLSAPAPIDGATVTMGSNSPSAVVPPAVVVPGGLTEASFTVATTSVYSVTPATLSASTGTTPATTTLQVNPSGVFYVTSLTVNPGGVVGGVTNPTGTVTLDAAAPTGGITVQVQSSNSSLASPATSTGGQVTFPAGASAETFSVTTFSTAAATPVTLTANVTNTGSGVAPQTAALTVNPASSLFLASVAASVPAEVGGGSFAVTGTVTLSTTSASNTVVALSTTDALVTVPSSVTVLAGSTTGTFPVTTSAVTAITPYYIVGTFSGASVSSTKLQLNPPLTITTTTPALPLGAVGVVYPASTLLARSGGAGTFTWSLINGTVLPAGMNPIGTGASAGLLSGTPTVPGTVTFTVQVVDTEGDAAQATLSIRVDNPAVTNPCGSLLGNESALSGHYAFLLQGFVGNGTSPIAMAGSFFANGTGGITGGEEDLNASAGVQHLSITNVASGAYTLGSDGRGCVQLKYTGGTTTSAIFHFAMGQKNGSNIDTVGRIIEFDDYAGTGTRAAGVIRLQNTSEFALTQLGPRYAFGSDGVDSSGGHFAIAGSFSVSSGGVISNLDFDTDDTGTLQTVTGGGSVGAPTGNGRMLVNFTSGAATVATNAVYIVNKNEFFVVGTAPLSSSPIYSGRVIATASSYTGSSLISGNYVFDLTGTDTGSGGNTACTSASPCSVFNTGIAVASFNAGQTGSFTGTVYETESGAIQANSIAGTTYTIDASSGRLALSGGDQQPVFYLAAPVTSGADTTEPISAFIVGSGATPSTGDPTAIFGFAEPQPSVTYSNSSLPTPFITATGDRGQASANTFVGSGTAAGGVQTILRDFSSSAGLEVNQAVSNAFTVNSDGTATAVGGGVVEGITNGTKFLLFNGSPAFVRIFEQQ